MDLGYNCIKDIYDSLLATVSLILVLLSLKKTPFRFTFIESKPRKMLLINLIKIRIIIYLNFNPFITEIQIWAKMLSC